MIFFLVNPYQNETTDDVPGQCKFLDNFNIYFTIGKIMVLPFRGSSDIGPHVRGDLNYLICSRHLFE